MRTRLNGPWMNTTALFLVTMVYGTLFAAAVAQVGGARWTFDATPAYVLSLGYLAVCGSVVAFVTYFALLKRVGAGPSSYARSK